MNPILVCASPARREAAEALCRRWGFTLASDMPAACPFALVLTDTRLELRKLDEPKLGPVAVDFVGGAVGHRRKFGGGRGQAIARAVGLKGGATPVVLDATAGLGRDAFVLASLGCRILLVERSPVVAALLEDGLARAAEDAQIGKWVVERMQLIPGSITEPLVLPTSPEVVYLDPMYPHRQKSAQVKKEMRVFQSLVGADTDADALLPAALALARKRVVVKRPDYAPDLAGQVPSTRITTKKNRFDIYIKPVDPD